MKKRFPIYVILDNIRSALNVGAIFRTCDAVRVSHLYLCGITCYPPHNRIPKTALGAIDTVPWSHVSSTERAIDQLKIINDQCAIITVEKTASSKSIWDYYFKFPTALVFGNEISGVEKGIIKKSDAVVKIPMFGKKESLNVATSCGVVLYEIARQYHD